MAKSGMQIRVQGAQETARALQQLPPRIASQLMRKALRAAAAPVLADARSGAPRTPDCYAERSA